VILDMLVRIEPKARFFVLDTGVLFEETYATWQRVEERYGVQIDVYRGEWLHELWTTEPDTCCKMRKVTPLRKALAGVDAWITGLRRDQSPSRADTPKLAWDSTHAKWKAAPLADWTEEDVWRYIAEHDVLYHPLHDRGFSSIGCAPCTVRGTGRDGRWAGTDKTECGLHLPERA
jgi:phosphoadenosine phosphosulfate reductase